MIGFPGENQDLPRQHPLDGYWRLTFHDAREKAEWEGFGRAWIVLARWTRQIASSPPYVGGVRGDFSPQGEGGTEVSFNSEQFYSHLLLIPSTHISR